MFHSKEMSVLFYWIDESAKIKKAKRTEHECLIHNPDISVYKLFSPDIFINIQIMLPWMVP